MIKSEKIAVDRTRSPTERDSCLTLLQSDAETNDGHVQMDLFFSFELCCGMEFSRLLEEIWKVNLRYSVILFKTVGTFVFRDNFRALIIDKLEFDFFMFYNLEMLQKYIRRLKRLCQGQLVFNCNV